MCQGLLTTYTPYNRHLEDAFAKNAHFFYRAQLKAEWKAWLFCLHFTLSPSTAGSSLSMLIIQGVCVPNFSHPLLRIKT